MLLFVSREILNEFVGNSTIILNWSIALVGASFLSIISTNYYKPSNQKKLVYLLLFPAWILLGFSVHYSINLFNTYTGTGFLNPKKEDYLDHLMQYGVEINSNYDKQITTFYWGCLIMITWFVIVVLLWIFDKENKNQKV